MICENALSTDTVNAVIRYSRELKAVPELEKMDGYFDFRQVEAVADEILQTLFAWQSDQTLKYVHHSSGIKVPIQGLNTHLTKLYGGVYERVSTLEWIRRATEVGMEVIVAKFMEAVIETGEARSFPFLEEEKYASGV